MKRIGSHINASTSACIRCDNVHCYEFNHLTADVNSFFLMNDEKLCRKMKRKCLLCLTQGVDVIDLISEFSVRQNVLEIMQKYFGELVIKTVVHSLN